MIRSAIDSLNQAEPLPYNWTPAASAMRAHSDWRGRRLDPCRDLVGHFPNEITFVAYRCLPNEPAFEDALARLPKWLEEPRLDSTLRTGGKITPLLMMHRFVTNH
jgi:hypothetical protein